MASANLELVRSIYAAWGRGDFSSVEWADPEIEFVVFDGLSRGRWVGLVQLGEAWRDFLTLFTTYRVEVEDYRELDDERVLVLVSHRGRGRTSGIEVAETQSAGANLLHIRDRKVTRLVLYWQRAHAFTDLGLGSGAETPPS
jgi:ketosteroid isomerase-like protein